MAPFIVDLGEHEKPLFRKTTDKAGIRHIMMLRPYKKLTREEHRRAQRKMNLLEKS